MSRTYDITKCFYLVGLTVLASAETATATDSENNDSPLLRSRNLQQIGDDLPNSLCWLPFLGCQADQCNQISALGEAEFDLDIFIEKTWYVQKQQVNPYQPEDELFCVTATYNRRENDDLVSVLNANVKGSVTGEANEPTEICSEQVDAGELRVAPCFLSLIFPIVAGPYWVLAVGDNYEWAIISGGQPEEIRDTVDGDVFCTTDTGTSFFSTNGSGLWLFTRTPVASDETIAAMEAKLTEFKISTDALQVVPQDGCSYPDHIKS